MQLLLVLLLSSFISGCATTSVDSFEEVELKEDPTEVYGFEEASINPNFKHVGKTVYVETNVPDVLTPALKKIQQALKAKGFIITKNRADAYLYVQLNDHELPAREAFGFDEETDLKTLKAAPGSTGKTEVSDTTTVTRYTRNNGKLRVFKYHGPSFKIFHAVYARVESQSYGKRPASVWFQIIYADELNKIVRSKELEEVTTALTAELVPGSEPVDSKKRPGCIPRFGYDYDNKAKFKIKIVEKNSPAFRAGLKPGDEVIAVDSYSIIEFNKEKISTPIYESLATVPIKIKRDGKILRLNIKSQIMCD